MKKKGVSGEGQIKARWDMNDYSRLIAKQKEGEELSHVESLLHRILYSKGVL